MRIDPEDFRRHYAMLSDEALFALNRSELIDVARACYDAEVARRRSTETAPNEPDAGQDQELEEGIPGELQADDDAPDWMEGAACVYGNADQDGPDQVAHAREALEAAGIPSYVTTEQRQGGRIEYCLNVPNGSILHATSVIERDFLNHLQEEIWRAHLAGLSDEEFRRLKPELFCAGLQDSLARLKKAYEDEAMERKRS